MARPKVEIRFTVEADFAAAIDAIALSEDKDRSVWIIETLTSDVKKVAHRMNVLYRMSRGNPLLSESAAGDSE